MNIIGYEIRHNLNNEEKECFNRILKNNGSCTGINSRCDICVISSRFTKKDHCLPVSYYCNYKKIDEDCSFDIDCSPDNQEYMDLKIELIKKILNYRERFQEELEI